MRLLFGENLSPKLWQMLSGTYPGSESVLLVGLGGSPNAVVWQYATDRALVIVSKDSDFVDRAVMSSGSVQFVWLRLGNCTTQSVCHALPAAEDSLRRFVESNDRVLELF